MRTLIYAIGILALAGCSGGSQFPEPTGKGTIRGINAVADSPTVVFRVENSNESRFRQSIDFRSASVPQEIDDFEYEFNFEFQFPFENELRRFASQRQKIDADQDYTFVVTGSMANPGVSVWTSTVREFDAAETVFELRFAHAAESLGRVDVYFAAPGSAPALGNARGTLGFGDILDPEEFPEGEFELILTAENDPATVLYHSISATYQPRIRQIVAVFDGTVDDTSPLSVRGLPVGSGDPLSFLPDARFGSTVRFVQASRDITTADIFNDEALTNRIVADHAYQDVTEELPIAAGETTFTYTAAGNPGAVQLEATVPAGTGVRYTLYSVGAGDSVGPGFFLDVRRPVAEFPQFALLNTDATRENLRIYVREPGTSINDADIVFTSAFGDFAGFVNLEPGDYEFVVTENSNENPAELAPPIPLTLAGGDVVRLIAFATADPNVLDIQPLP